MSSILKQALSVSGRRVSFRRPVFSYFQYGRSFPAPIVPRMPSLLSFRLSLVFLLTVFASGSLAADGAEAALSSDPARLTRAPQLEEHPLRTSRSGAKLSFPLSDARSSGLNAVSALAHTAWCAARRGMPLSGGAGVVRLSLIKSSDFGAFATRYEKTLVSL